MTINYMREIVKMKMNQQTKARILYVIGIIFITAVCISSCEAQGNIQESDLIFQKVGSGIR